MENNIVKYLMTMASVMQGGDRITGDAAKFLHDRLKEYPEKSVIDALNRCLHELKFFPSFSEIVERIDDGRPNDDEAWAMIPQDEMGSVVWCEEMQAAYRVAYQLIKAQDMIAARMAFKKTYSEAVTLARAKKIPVRWTPSFGVDRSSRIMAINAAIDARRLSIEAAATLLPELPEIKTGAIGIAYTGNGNKDVVQIKNLIGATIKKLENRGDEK
jgi:hypothetical protein